MPVLTIGEPVPYTRVDPTSEITRRQPGASGPQKISRRTRKGSPGRSSGRSTTTAHEPRGEPRSPHEPRHEPRQPEHSTTSNTGNRNTGGPRRGLRTALALAAGTAAAAASLAIPAGVGHAYSTGVKSLHFVGAADECQPGQALPCTSGAGIGEANVLTVSQEVVDGYLRFNTLGSTSSVDDSIWVAVEMGAECRLWHDMTLAGIDSNIGDTSSGVRLNADALGDGTDFPLYLPLPDGEVLHNAIRAVNVPMTTAFEAGLVWSFADPQEVFDAGEAEIDRRIDEGMSAAEARALPYELNTSITLAAEVVCDLPGLAQPRYVRTSAAIPLRIDYLPAEAAPAIGGSRGDAGHGLTIAPEVTDVELSVVPDPADPCTLHLSGVVETNGATPVQYRFIDPHGQPSNTYQIDIDDSQIGFFSRHVAVPQAAVADPQGDLTTLEPDHGIGGWAVLPAADDAYTGTYMLEVISPNHDSDADGFSVPFCPADAPSQAAGATVVLPTNTLRGQ